MTNIYRHNCVGMFWEFPWTWSIVSDGEVVATGTAMTERAAARRAARHS